MSKSKKPKSNLVRIVILVTAEENRRIRRLAKKRDKFMGDIVREAAPRLFSARA